MNSFTSREAVGDLLRLDSKINPKTRIFTRKVRLDSKGRILLPAEVRRNFGLDKDLEIKIVYTLEKNQILLVIGQDGVAESIEDCGSSGPGAIPGPDPDKFEEGGAKDG